jgi:pimeloyl-ACP methyl ester carboxylesterase
MRKKTIALQFLLSFLGARAQEALYPPNFNASEELFIYLPGTNVTLCYQTIGNPADPAVLLVGGAGSSMMLFSPQFIHLLSPPEDPHYVVRFDLRDTGRSTAFPLVSDPAAPPPYLLQDLSADVVQLMDHLSVPVHLVGFSSGGPLAFAAAAQRPHLTKSLFLGLTSPTGLEGHDGLPPAKPLSDDIVSQLGPPPALSDPQESWVDYLSRRRFTGAASPMRRCSRARITSLPSYTRVAGRGKRCGTLNAQPW